VSGEYRFFDPKADRSRRAVPLPDDLRTALHKHRARQLEERLRAGSAWQSDDFADLVFTDQVGKPLSGYHVTRRFRKLLKDSGLARMRYHDLRHAAASLMAAQGVPVRVAMEILGHSQISTTMNIYAHVAPDYQRDAMERVVSAISAGS
jgi:integrase